MIKGVQMKRLSGSAGGPHVMIRVLVRDRQEGQDPKGDVRVGAERT